MSERVSLFNFQGEKIQKNVSGNRTLSVESAVHAYTTLLASNGLI